MIICTLIWPQSADCWFTFDDYLLPDYDLNKDQPPHFKLTGGGPNYFTKEGAAMFISMYKDGWRPYSRAYLKYDENGEPLFKNGEPVYEYKTYENLPDPIVSFVRIMVDFTDFSGTDGGWV